MEVYAAEHECWDEDSETQELEEVIAMLAEGQDIDIEEDEAQQILMSYQESMKARGDQRLARGFPRTAGTSGCKGSLNFRS